MPIRAVLSAVQMKWPIVVQRTRTSVAGNRSPIGDHIKQSAIGLDWIGLSSVLRPRRHSIGWETVFTGQKTQPTVSKY